MRIRLYELAGELGVESRELLRQARILGLDVTSPLAGVAAEDADQMRAAIQNPDPPAIRAYELARELGVESRDILERARVLGIDVTSPLGSISLDDADRIGALPDLARLSQDRRTMLAAGTEFLLDHTAPPDRILIRDENVSTEDTGEPDHRAEGRVARVEQGDADQAPAPAASEEGPRGPSAEPTTGESKDPLAEEPPSDPRLGEPAATHNSEHFDSTFAPTPMTEKKNRQPSNDRPELSPRDPFPEAPQAPDSEMPNDTLPRQELSVGETDGRTSHARADRNTPVRARQQNRNRRAVALGSPSRPTPVVPNAPAHHLPSGRFQVAYLLLLATIFAIPFEQGVLIPGLGTVAKALGLATFAAWFLGLLVSGRMRAPVLFHYLFFALGVWISLSLYWSLDTSATAGRIVTFLLLFALVLVIWDLCDTPAAIRAALQAYVLGTWVAAISVYVNFAQNNQVKYGRFAADGAADPNVTSLFLAIGLPIAWYLFLNAENRAARWINLAYIPAGVLAMALSGSRGGFIAGSVAIVYAAITFPRNKPFAFISALLVLIGAVVVVVMLVPPESFERIGTVDESIASGDLNGRTEIWQRAWDVYIDYPLLGTGAGSTREVLGLDKVGHNVFVTAGLETGAIGVVLMAAILIVVFRQALSMDRGDRRMWLTVLIMWSIGAMSLDLATKKVTWLLFGLLVAAAATVATAARSAPHESVGGALTAADALSGPAQSTRA